MFYRVDFFYKIANAIFYAAIVSVVYLYNIDDNSVLWLLTEGLVIVGIVGSIIPDLMINLDENGIDIKLVRMLLLIKYLVFFIVHGCLDKYFTITIIAVGILFFADLILEGKLFRQLDEVGMSVDDFINKMNKTDTTKVDSIKKYIGIYILDILLYLNIHNSIYELVCMFIISLVVHCFISEKIIKQMKDYKLIYIRIVLWCEFGITMAFASLDYKMITYSLIGTYVMIVVDLLQQKKTSLIKGNIFLKK